MQFLMFLHVCCLLYCKGFDYGTRKHFGLVTYSNLNFLFMDVSFCFSWTGFEDLQKNSFQKHY